MLADYDGDFWADHDENIHGRIDELQEDFPEGYRWTCCNKLGNEEGCEIGMHNSLLVENERERKRERR